MDSKIAILYTSFLRDELMAVTVKSITKNMPDNAVLLIADQNPSVEKFSQYHSEQVRYFSVPYDFGLSASRNFLVDEAIKLKCKHCLLTADSIQFTAKYDLTPYINSLNAMTEIGLIGFGLKGRQAWEMKMELKSDGFHMSPSTEQITFDDINFTVCDTVKNFFLAKTATLTDIRWDSELKLCEHEDFMLRLKLAGYKVLFSGKIEAEYINAKPEEYAKLRNRLYAEFAEKLKRKYGIKSNSGWIKYDKHLTK